MAARIGDGLDGFWLPCQQGGEILAAAGDQAKEGQINEVSYMSPKPGADKTWVPKASLVTAVGGLGCGVGYYK